MTGNNIQRRLNLKMKLIEIQPVAHCQKLDLKTKPEEHSKKKGKKRKRITCISSKRSKKPKLDPLLITTEKCCFCLTGPDKEKGTFFQDASSNIAAHQFCLLFSAGLPQAGNDDEGFEGFLVADIRKELQRVSKLICKFCGRNGANLGCCVQHCRSIYHFNCGYKAGLQFQFCGSFDTYCQVHCSRQDLSLVKTKGKDLFCPICLENFTALASISSDKVLKTPCCNNVFVHKECVQRQASVAGYFFRCPCCNNKDEFTDEMAKYGIYIPSRDAAWEESDAYGDLLEEYNKCDVNRCRCPKGRKYSTLAGKWHLLRCYLCGQSAVHVKCLGQCYIPGIGYVCTTCNKVAKLNEQNIETVQQQSYTERLKEHRRRLNLLKARNDPVLLASDVFSKEIWFKKYNITTDCKVNLRKLDINLKSRKMKLSTALKFLQNQNENKAEPKKDPKKRSTSQNYNNTHAKLNKFGINTQYMFRDRGSRGESLLSHYDLFKTDSTSNNGCNTADDHPTALANPSTDIDINNNNNDVQFLDKNSEADLTDKSNTQKGDKYYEATPNSQNKENLVESVISPKETDSSMKISDAESVNAQRLRDPTAPSNVLKSPVQDSKIVLPDADEPSSQIRSAERLKLVVLRNRKPIISQDATNTSHPSKTQSTPVYSDDNTNPRKTPNLKLNEQKPMNNDSKSSIFLSSMERSKNTTERLLSLRSRAVPTVNTIIRSGAVPTMKVKPQSPFHIVWTPNTGNTSLDNLLNSPITPGRCFLGFDGDLKPVYCDKCYHCGTSNHTISLSSTKSKTPILNHAAILSNVKTNKSKLPITRHEKIEHPVSTKSPTGTCDNAQGTETSCTPLSDSSATTTTITPNLQSNPSFIDSPSTPYCCFLGFDSELKPIYCKECKIASPSARTAGPCSNQLNFLTPMKADSPVSKFPGYLHRDTLLASRKQLYRSNERLHIPIPCLDIKQLVGKNPDDEKYTKIWTPYKDCSQFFRPYSYRDAKGNHGSVSRSNDIAMALLEEAFERNDALDIIVESM